MQPFIGFSGDLMLYLEEALSGREHRLFLLPTAVLLLFGIKARLTHPALWFLPWLALSTESFSRSSGETPDRRYTQAGDGWVRVVQSPQSLTSA